MSRSTPLQNLPNLKNNSSNAYDEKENQLVKEILQEIDTGKQESQQIPSLDSEPIQIIPEQQQEMEMQQNVEQHMNEQQMMHDQMIDNMEMEPQQLSTLDNIMSQARQPLIVALIAIVVSIPTLTTFIENMLKSNARFASYAMMITLLVKGVLAAALYFGINKSV